MSTTSAAERVADILDEHRTTTRDGMSNVCTCGWGDVTTWGHRQSWHVATVLSEAGLLAGDAFPPDTPEWATWQHALAQLKANLAARARKLSGGP